MPDSELLTRLQTTIEGLQWMSESDYPFEVCYWQDCDGDMAPEKLLELTQHEGNAAIELRDIDSFFEWATQPQEWHSPEEQEAVKKYQALVRLIKQLSDPNVYRIGQINLDIYILGKTEEGAIAGVKTKAVET
ncbi:nuclease A inhibitor family protein [Leptolyngbya sp. FACHB-36]|uniref:nuclease A inhibitor family protein n=1 Tax=Leptolyngbya sp. FACHB-36 TaxID=2692808 RepID=UPI0016809195|nr:nuclease A inhibitor family protein [Leptolyngbya sp. FACHB-36]MBD2019502.1 nuclease A inhibitor family protein [Leptolyngbya sp. FACHB-36]